MGLIMRLGGVYETRGDSLMCHALSGICIIAGQVPREIGNLSAPSHSTQSGSSRH